ncbi:MAG: DUF4349 domain-containing protein [Cyclobacteriaceae bacterium]|nr:DUF4349 domain-containing protein [Cyclobacteriaceae bacterium]
MKTNLLLILFVLFLSCDTRKAAKFVPDNEASMGFKEVAFDASASEQAEQIVSIERKLIRNGQLEFKTKDIKKAKVEIEKISKELNGYISGENENNYGDRLQYNQTIRVPADQFDNLIKQIEVLADKVENKGINTQDVTEEFIDVEARLKTKKELESRYSEILKQAKTVADILAIESQIADVRSEIESMTGRLNYLKNQVSFSTLNLSYYQTIGTDFGFASKLVESLKGGWDNLLTFLIFLINLWPFVIGIVVVVIWWLRRRKAKRAS